MSYFELNLSAPSGAGGLERRLEIDGEDWRVYERPAAPFDRRQTASLVFESRGAIRRVRDYPSDWRALSDEALVVLSWRC